VRISILMPTYECPPELLEKAVISVLKQTHQDVELILKDGSVNKPAVENARIAALVESAGSKVRYLLESDGSPRSLGFYPALNACLEASTGSILTFLGADDECADDETLAFVNTEFENHLSSPFLIYGIVEHIDSESKHLHNWESPVPVTYENMLSGAGAVATPAVFWNREVHHKFGMFDVSYPWAADFDFWTRCWRGTETKFVPRVLGRYRHWEVSGNASHLPQCEAEWRAIQKKRLESE
jgi:glycosyltransferase involved in cell wall biosynthesis